MPADLNAAEAEVRRLAEAAFAELLARINAGETSREAIAAIQARFSGKYAKALARQFTALLGEFIGVGQVKALTIGKVKLSSRLYENETEVTAAVRRTIVAHAKGMAEARTLALQLFEGYGFKGGADPLKVKAALPKYLAEVLRDAEFGAAFKPLARRISQSVAKTEALKAAYMQALETVIEGKGADRLARALRVAQFEQNRYFANRIAQTELHRADTRRIAADVIADGQLEAVQIVTSATHPREDICDLHAKVDKWSLGPGVYPKAQAPQPPFHPFCRCLIRKRYDVRAAGAQEVPGADRDWLRDSGNGAAIMGSRDKLAQVLGGRGVENVLNDGKDPLYHVRRLGDPPERGITARKGKAPIVPPAAPVVPPVAPPVAPVVPATLDEFLAAGKSIRTELPLFMAGREADWHNALIDRMMAAGRLGAKAEVSTGGEGSKLVRTAATFFPKTWVDATNAFGELKVKTIGPRARAHAWTANRDISATRLADWGMLRDVKQGTGFITVGKDDLATAIHEYGHRVQSALPALDDVFQQLHRRRVAGAPVRRIKDIGPQYAHYPSGEVAREDGYLSPYQGKEYRTSRAAFGGGTLDAADGGALEVLTVAVEAVLGGNASRPRSTGGVLSNWQLRDMFIKDREMIDLVLGLIFHWNP